MLRVCGILQETVAACRPLLRSSCPGSQPVQDSQQRLASIVGCARQVWCWLTASLANPTGEAASRCNAQGCKLVTTLDASFNPQVCRALAGSMTSSAAMQLLHTLHRSSLDVYGPSAGACLAACPGEQLTRAACRWCMQPSQLTRRCCWCCTAAEPVASVHGDSKQPSFLWRMLLSSHSARAHITDHV